MLMLSWRQPTTWPHVSNGTAWTGSRPPTCPPACWRTRLSALSDVADRVRRWIRGTPAPRSAAGRNETGVPLRQDALDLGFHDVPAGPAYAGCDADGAGVT